MKLNELKFDAQKDKVDIMQVEKEEDKNGKDDILGSSASNSSDEMCQVDLQINKMNQMLSS